MKNALAILLAFAPLTLAADEIAWGAPVDGFRLGVALDPIATSPMLRVLIENKTGKAHNVLVNYKTGTRMYPLRVYATSPDGKQQYDDGRQRLGPCLSSVLRPCPCMRGWKQAQPTNTG